MSSIIYIVYGASIFCVTILNVAPNFQACTDSDIDCYVSRYDKDTSSSEKLEVKSWLDQEALMLALASEWYSQSSSEVCAM